MANKKLLGPDSVDVKTLTAGQFKRQKDAAVGLLRAFVHQAYRDHEI